MSEIQIIKKVMAKTSSGALLANDCITHFIDSALPFGGVGECMAVKPTSSNNTHHPSDLQDLYCLYKLAPHLFLPQVTVVWVATVAATALISSVTFAAA